MSILKEFEERLKEIVNNSGYEVDNLSIEKI